MTTRLYQGWTPVKGHADLEELWELLGGAGDYDSMTLTGPAIVTGGGNDLQLGTVSGPIASTTDAIVAYQMPTSPFNPSGAEGSLLLYARNTPGAEIVFATENVVRVRVSANGVIASTVSFGTGSIANLTVGALTVTGVLSGSSATFSGAVTALSLTATGAGANGRIGWTGRSIMYSSVDGLVEFRSNADNAYAAIAVSQVSASTSVNVSSAGGMALGNLTQRRRLIAPTASTFEFRTDTDALGALTIAGLTATTGAFSGGITGTTLALSGTLTVGGLAGALVNALTFGAHLTPAGGTYNNTAAVTLATDATPVNVPSTIVSRGASGEIAIGPITATTGTFTGHLTGTTASFPGGITGAGAPLSFGAHLTPPGGTYDGSSAVTLATDATPVNTPNTIISRGASGEFVAGNVTVANLTVLGTITGGAPGGAILGNPLSFGAHMTPASGSYNNSATVTLATDATPVNTPNTIVSRGASGEFAAGNVTVANLTVTGTITGGGAGGSITAADVGPGTFPAGNFTFSNNLTVGGVLTANSATITTTLTTNNATVNGTLTVNNATVNGTLNASSATFASPVGPTSGGTGLSSYAAGDLPYASAANTLSKLAVGATDQVLTVVGGFPAWRAIAWASITGTPTTLGGYGITDAYTKAASDARFAPIGASAGSILTFGAHLTGGSYNGSAAVTLATDATAVNAANTIVGRGAAGEVALGALTLGPATKALLLTSAPGTGDSPIVFQRNGVDRWRLRLSANPESGANAGSELVLDAMDDAGTTVVGQWVFVSRATGLTGLGGAGLATDNIRMSTATALTVRNQAGTALATWTHGNGLFNQLYPMVVGSDPGGSETLRVGGSTRATAFVGNNGPNPVLYSGATPLMRSTGPYNVVQSPDGTDAWFVGDAGDPSIYHNANAHIFRNRGGSGVYANLDGTGMAVTGQVSATTTVQGAHVSITDPGNAPWMRLLDGTQAANAKNWLVIFTGSTFSIAAYDDALVSNVAAISITRSGINPIGMILKGSVTADALKVVGNLGFFNTTPSSKGTVSGARASNAALGSLLNVLAAYGLLVNSSTT